MQKRLLHQLLLLLALIFGLEVSAQTGDAPAAVHQSTGICENQSLHSIVIQTFKRVELVQIRVMRTDAELIHRRGSEFGRRRGAEERGAQGDECGAGEVSGGVWGDDGVRSIIIPLKIRVEFLL
jgi:hypothetical protein